MLVICVRKCSHSQKGSLKSTDEDSVAGVRKRSRQPSDYDLSMGSVRCKSQ